MAVAFRSAAALTTAGATTISVPYPAGVATDDLLLIQYSDNEFTGGAAPATPAGWTKLFGPLAQPGNPSYASYLFYRVAGASEPGSVTITTATATRQNALMSAWTGCSTTTPIDVYATADLPTSGVTNIDCPSATTTQANTLILHMYWAVALSTTINPNASDAERYDNYNTFSGVWELATHLQASAGASGVSTAAVVAAGSVVGGSSATIALAPPFVAPPFVPQIIWFTPAAATTPTVPTYESSISYASVANRPAVTGTTRPFASSAALTGALNAAAPGDLVQYTGAGVLDIAGNYTGFCGRRYTGYVNIDLGLPASANHVRFTGGGGAGLPAVAIYNSAYLRIYGGEITNPPPKTVGYDGLHIYGAQNPGNGSTHHITWWNLSVHDTVDSGIKMLPNVVAGGGSAADNTIADCDIEATVAMIGLDKSVDTSHAERGTGQHCCLLADTDPAGATYPSFLRNRVAIDGSNTGLSSSQGGGSIIELGFNDAASTITGCTLIMRGANTMFNAQQQTGGNGLNLWGSAAINAAVPFLQHSNATGSPVCNPGGVNRSGVVVAYGRHTLTNLNAYEGTNPWQIGPTYRDVA